jgi:2-isopropylmalate synthase
LFFFALFAVNFINSKFEKEVAMSTIIEEEVVEHKNGKVGARLPSSREYSRSNWREAGEKYCAFPPVHLPDRTWPDKQITKAPIWCSVDLRDGNQALAIPMNISEKLEMFKLLCEIGFKEIEIGFPSASQVEFDFCRKLIEDDLIPADVTVQILVQCREELIRRSFEALQGARRAIVHIYNSTNPAQREIVFGMSRDQIKNIAVDATKLVKQLASENPDTDWVLQYSPESFCLTELDFSLEICQAVCDVWQPTPDKKIILNLPATVESFTPNVHADQIEWFCRNLNQKLSRRDSAIISLHTHNDRGTGVAATELALMAGAERVEGTLFGNGERTGNLDIVTVALNMRSQGVASHLDFSNLPRVREIYERTTRMTVHERHPYAGDLVFTAFSGSHQDAISKGFKRQSEDGLWQVPYLPIDPKDLGRDYKAIIRINTQSGKGGVAYILESDFEFDLPKDMKIEFGKIINELADERGVELSRQEIYDAFEREYLARETPLKLEKFRAMITQSGKVECKARVLWDGETRDLKASGNGPIDAFVVALREAGAPQFDILKFAEHSLEGGKDARAVAYIQIGLENARTFFGAAIDTNIELASIKAVVSALNRALSR